MGGTVARGFVSQSDFDSLAETAPEKNVHIARLGVRVRDVGLMLYTSGTTAHPKGCLITHEAQVRNSIALGRHRYRLTHEDRFWSPLPMFHIASVLPMLAIFDVGGTYLTMSYFDAGVALDMLERHEVTATYPCFVTIMQGLIYHPNFARANLSRIKLMNSNFAVQPAAVAESIMRAMPQAVQVGSFGMTETAGTVCTGSPDEAESLRSPAGTCIPVFAARCWCAATACSRAITRTRKKPLKPSTATAGSTPGISARSTNMAPSCFTAGTRTCSRSAARTWPPPKSRRCSAGIRR
jgi:acyl-CoA synthetase (AMP-forming)/AMP-acid ligase II